MLPEFYSFRFQVMVIEGLIGTHSQNEVHGAGLHIIGIVGEVKLTYELLAVDP